MIKQLQNDIKELEKGCGKKISYSNYHLYCGNANSLRIVYCPLCQAKLSAKKEDLELAKNFIETLKARIFYHWDCNMRCRDIDETWLSPEDCNEIIDKLASSEKEK